WVGLLGVALGAGGAIAARDRLATAADECKTGCKPRPPASAASVSCPAHFEDGKLAVTDAAEAEEVRTALMQGVLERWFDLGRAPTPAEIGARLKLDPAATDHVMDTLAACGSAVEFGVHRVPDSDLIAVAWPLSNVPTGIDVTLEGKKPVHARCAV